MVEITINSILMTLKVSEVFYSIQGEGNWTGVPSVFLRLTGCNLLCKGSGWVCDTIEVWRKGKATEFKSIIKEEWVEFLRRGAHLVITGGEPLLQQQRIIEYFVWFKKKYGVMPFVEIETNGTIDPDNFLCALVSQWNVSPKLESSGADPEKRYNTVVLNKLSSLPTTYKFVVSDENDVREILNNYAYYFPFEKITLMVAGDRAEMLNESRKTVIELCKKYGFRFSDRLHITAWDKKTGV